MSKLVIFLVSCIFIFGCGVDGDDPTPKKPFEGSWRGACEVRDDGTSYKHGISFLGHGFEQAFKVRFQSNNCTGALRVSLYTAKIEYSDPIVGSNCVVYKYETSEARTENRGITFDANPIKGSVCFFDGNIFLGDEDGNIDFSKPYTEIFRGGAIAV